MIKRLFRVPRWAREIILATVACGLDLVIQSRLGTSFDGAPTGYVIAYAALGFAFLPLRHRFPYLVYGVLCLHSTIACAVYQLGYYPLLGPLLALYAIAEDRGTRAALYALLLFGVPSALLVTDTMEAFDGSWRIGFTIIVQQICYGTTAIVAGLLVRRSHRLGQVQAQAAVDAERMRIARELHDIVAHSVTVMVLQGAGARRMLSTQPRRADQALADIDTIGKQAMDELRRLLMVLRAPDPTGESTMDHSGDAVSAIRSPQPRLTDLDRLLAQVRGTGLRVSRHITGQPRHLDPSVDLTAYRVVQEALTNVTKHAAPDAGTTVALDWTDEQLTVHIANEPCPPPRRPVPSCGYGLTGLRERVGLVGGTLTAGHTPEGGFAVTATLPVTQVRQHTGSGS